MFFFCILFVLVGKGKEELSVLSVAQYVNENNTADSGHNCDFCLDRPAVQNVLFPLSFPQLLNCFG